MLELSRHTPPSLPVPFKSDKTAALPSRILTDRAASVRAGSKSLFESRMPMRLGGLVVF